MAQIISATYQDGAFVPDEPVSVAAGTRVRLTVEGVDESATAQQAPNIDRSRVVAPKDAIARFNELCERVQLKSGLRMTRDELHERD